MSADKASGSLLASPRTNLRRVLGPALPLLDTEEKAALSALVPADAENKLNLRRLYLVLDLDETLVYSKRLEAGAIPKGTQILVRGQPFDMVTRPGLPHFLERCATDFVVFLYTMGDEEYTRAVLSVIDPEGKYFRGGICFWRPSESRQHKHLGRVACERRMALIVDDSVDVWGDDLANLCITRRFVGDKLDDGLQLLSWQLSQAHAAFYANAPSDGFSYNVAAAGSPRAPPSVFTVLADQRGQLLAGCTIALTGVVTDLREDSLEGQPLVVLIRLYGGQTTLDVDVATHLVARRKDGWRTSPKIRRALSRLKEGAQDFHAVWDHWLLDTLSSWQKQAETSYAIEIDDEREPSPPGRLQEAAQQAQTPSPAACVASVDVRAPDENVDQTTAAEEELPPRKRARADIVGINGTAMLSVAAPGVSTTYLQQLQPSQAGV